MKSNRDIATAASVGDSLEVLYVGNLPPHQGGSALSAAMLLPRLAALGWKVRSLAPMTREHIEAARCFDAKHPQLGVQRFKVSRMIVNPAHPSAAEWVAKDAAIVAEAFGRAVAVARPDVVLLGRETYLTSVDAELSRRQIPTILRVAGVYLQSALIGGFSPQYAEQLMGAVARQNRVVVQAAHYGDFLRAHGLTNVSLIPNGVDMEFFSPGPPDPTTLRRWGAGPEDFVAVHISNMKELKRPLDIVESIPHVLAAEPRVIFVFVGEGPMLAEVRSQVSARGLDRAVRFEPWGDPEAVVRYIRSSSAVIMPSEFEHQSRVCMESQSCGRLLIASDVPGARELVTDGASGLLFRMGDYRDLAGKTIHAVRHPERMAAIGRQAREAVRSHSADLVATQYSDLLKRVTCGESVALDLGA